MATHTKQPPMIAPSLYGLLAEFRTPGELLDAARRVRSAGYARMEAYTPFPVHGLDDALGRRPTRVALLVLLAGILGGFTGFFMCWYAFVVYYPLNIGGRPFNSWPAWIPITFELTVLFAGLAAAIGMLAINGLPQPHHPLFYAPSFARASQDRFFLCIEAADPSFKPTETRDMLQSLHPLSITDVPTVESPSGNGSRLLACLAVAGLLACIPGCNYWDPLVNQPKEKPLRESKFFPDASSARPLVPGTVWREADPRYAVLSNGAPVDPAAGLESSGAAGAPATNPFAQRPVTLADLRRGQERFTIYCTPCHGATGDGNGMIVQRGFTRPPSYHTERLRNAPTQHFVEVITNGYGAMYSYAERVSVEDRWRIAAYIRALQLSQNAPVDQLSETDRRALAATATVPADPAGGPK